MLVFADWITGKYVEWRGPSIGNEKSIAEFSRMLGIPPSLMSQWMKKGGKVPSSKKYIDALIKIYGSDVYDVLGLPSPQSDEDLLAGFPAEWRERFLLARSEYTAELAKQGITTDTPEAEQIITDALVRHGINFTLTHGSV